MTSAADAAGFPREALDEIALVGRSNVGKSSLINALVRQRLARTSGAPGKTRLANIYRVVRGGGAPFHLVDLPGYGYARRGPEDAGGSGSPGAFEAIARVAFARNPAAVLIVDARHPGLDRDLQAWTWMRAAVTDREIVASKIDKLSRAERLRAMKAHEAVLGHPVLPVSAETGEGLDELWTLIDRMLTSRKPRPRANNQPEPAPPPRPRRHRPKS